MSVNWCPGPLVEFEPNCGDRADLVDAGDPDFKLCRRAVLVVPVKQLLDGAGEQVGTDIPENRRVLMESGVSSLLPGPTWLRRCNAESLQQLPRVRSSSWHCCSWRVLLSSKQKRTVLLELNCQHLRDAVSVSRLTYAQRIPRGITIWKKIRLIHNSAVRWPAASASDINESVHLCIGLWRATLARPNTKGEPLFPMDATNESWLKRLSETGSVQDEALADLREILFRRLRRAFRGRTGVDEALLEDVTQEAMFKALNSLDQFLGKSRFTTWATTIAVRAAFTELRRRHWKDVSLEHMVEESGEGPGNTTDTGFGPESAVEQKALVEDMYRIIDSELTEKQRTALLAELRGMPLAEIGRRLGSNRNAVYKLTHDARKRLKQGLEAVGYTAAGSPDSLKGNTGWRSRDNNSTN